MVLVFAASDPTGGAGLQADVMTIASLGCHPLSVVTGLTVQDSAGVEAFVPVDADCIDDQARCLLEDMTIQAFKIGVLGSADAVAAVASVIADYPDIPVILDPVLASGRGDRLSDGQTLEAMRRLLLPQTTVLTPNSVEARRLADTSSRPTYADDEDDADDADDGDDSDDHAASHLSADGTRQHASSGQSRDRLRSGALLQEDPHRDLARCATSLAEWGCEYVLITGTHEPTNEVINTLYTREGVVRSDNWQRLPGSYHGSGCTLASAIAALMANGLPIENAVREAQAYTWQALRSGFRPGMGQHIPDRFFWARQLEERQQTSSLDSSPQETPLLAEEALYPAALNQSDRSA